MKTLERQDQIEQWTKLLLFSQRLPARTTSVGAGVLLGMTEVEISVLVGKKLLKPLGTPAPKAMKWFATNELARLSDDRNWLAKATQVIQQEWRSRNSPRLAANSDSTEAPAIA